MRTRRRRYHPSCAAATPRRARCRAMRISTGGVMDPSRWALATSSSRFRPSASRRHRDQPYKEVQDAHYYAAAAASHHQFPPDCRAFLGAVYRSSQRGGSGLRPAAAEAEAGIPETSARRGHDLRHEGGSRASEEAGRDGREGAHAGAAPVARMLPPEWTESAAGTRGGALSIGDLEGGRRGAGGSRKRGAAGPRRHRRPEYDSDDDLPSGARRQDNYDLDDGFLVDSDEESEEAADDDEEEEILDDDDEDEPAPRAKRQKTADAEG